MLKKLQAYRKVASINNSWLPFTQIPHVNIYHICYIILSLSFIYMADMMLLYLYLFNYVSPKHKGILLDNYVQW